MTTGNAGLTLIKEFEGLRLTTYWDSYGGVWTIGYGHTNGVYEGMTITQAQADAFLVQDVATAETAVNSHNPPYDWTQNQFDALVSFTFNLGSGNLNQLTQNDTRTIAEISEAILLYVNAGGVPLPGLVRRRQAEKALFDSTEEGGGVGGGGGSDTPYDSYLEGVKRVTEYIAGKQGYNYTRREMALTIMEVYKAFNARDWG